MNQLKQVYRERLLKYQTEARSSLYVNGLKKAYWYLQRYPVKEIRPGVYEVYSVGDLQELRRGQVDQILVHETTLTNCSCFETHGRKRAATCVHQEIVKLCVSTTKTETSSQTPSQKPVEYSA